MIFTMQDWKKDFSEDIKPFFDVETLTAEISEDVYYNFMESLPPIGIYKGFMNSEPADHDRHGKPRYNAFQNIDGKYYYIGRLTRNYAESILPKNK
jgi:hypothetical protein